MNIEDARRMIEADDRDYLKEYSKAIEQHSEAALNGDQKSIAWVKASLCQWAQGETSYEPPPALLRVAALHFLGNEAVVPLRRAQEFELPEELDAANIAFHAVRNDADRGDLQAPFKERIEQFLRNNWPSGTFTEDAIKRICTVSNIDRKTGPKRKKSF